MKNDAQARSGGRILVDNLRAQGVERIFCVPGESYLDVLDALVDHPQIDVIVTKHEGAAANMAEADGKLTGRPGICFVTRGPGATHASCGVHIAFQDSTPMILFIGQVAREQRGREAFQEVEYREMFGPLAKWVVEIDDTARIPEIIARAFTVAISGRPGPVVVALPEDVLSEMATVADTARARAPVVAPSPADVVALSGMLARAERPLLIVGGSNWSEQAAADLRRFAEHWKLPVAASFRRQDIFDNRHPNYIGHMSLGINPKLAQRVREADLILALGTRLGDVTTDGYTHLTPPNSQQQLVHIHVDGNELGRVYQADLAIQSCNAAAAALLASLSAPARPAWAQWTEGARADFESFSRLGARAAGSVGVDLGAVVAQLDRILPDDAILTNGAGNYTIWLHRHYQYRQPRTQLAPTCGAMGYGFPAALAAARRHPDRPVVCFAGDGCFLMYPQELATAVQYGIALIVIVCNNGMYGTIRMHQEKRFPGRVSATTLQGPDFVALAQSFGAYGERVEKEEDFMAAFERARASGKPALLELCQDARQITPAMRLG